MTPSIEVGMTKKLLELDALVPSQFFENLGKRAANKTGERRLLYAVLQDAVDCFQKNAMVGDRRFLEAEKWIMDTHGTAVLSFEYVCSVLDLDPQYVRQGLQRWRAATSKVERRPNKPAR
jgi:hypothetical protein